jgi:hypothetical protein
MSRLAFCLSGALSVGAKLNMLPYVLSLLRMRGNIHTFFLTIYLARYLIKHRDNFIFLLFHEIYHISNKPGNVFMVHE